MLREAQLEAFVAGNLRENEAAEMVRGVRAALPAAPLAAERLPVRRLRRLPPGGATRQFLAGNPEEPNGALEMYLQVGDMGRYGEIWGDALAGGGRPGGRDPRSQCRTLTQDVCVSVSVYVWQPCWLSV